MSSQVLARKWRPSTFTEVVGQTHVLQALTHALDANRLHHAYLFSGTRGVGKTTLARLFAKGLNCEQGLTSEPCGACSSCLEIRDGRFVDLIEIDAASKTKVDDTRELLDNVMYMPTRGRYKVYLIDEVHMLSRSSFNALLKTLEEPPSHVKFLLATTEPQKLPVTVLSRCFQFNLKSLNQTQIEQQLAKVLTEERILFESNALSLLSQKAQGSMRDALSLTDQAIAHGCGAVNFAQVQAMLGTLRGDYALELWSALSDVDTPKLFKLIQDLFASGIEADAILCGLLELCHQVYIVQQVPDALQAMPDTHSIAELVDHIESHTVHTWYKSLLQSRKLLPYAPDMQSAIEVALLSLMTQHQTTHSSTAVVEVEAPRDHLVSQMEQIEHKASLLRPVLSKDIDQNQAEISAKAQAENPVETQAENPVETQAENPLETQAENPLETQAENPVETQAENPVETQAENPLETQVETSVETQVEAQVETQVETSVKAQAETPVDTFSARDSSDSTAYLSDSAQDLLQSVIAMRQSLIKQVQAASGETEQKKKAILKQSRKDTVESASQDILIEEKHVSYNDSVPVDPVDDVLSEVEQPLVLETSDVDCEDVSTDTIIDSGVSHVCVDTQSPHLSYFVDKLSDVVDEDKFWFVCLLQLQLGGRAYQLGVHAILNREAQDFTLMIPEMHKHLMSDAVTQSLERALSDHMQKKIQLTIEVAECEERHSPAQIKDKVQKLCVNEAEQRLLKSPSIHYIMQHFQAEIAQDSIEYPLAWIDPTG